MESSLPIKCPSCGAMTDHEDMATFNTVYLPILNAITRQYGKYVCQDCADLWIVCEACAKPIAPGEGVTTNVAGVDYLECDNCAGTISEDAKRDAAEIRHMRRATR